ncbi:alpha/beta hydrolase [Aestuariibacter sp. GS-14]|uniref:alpha/beta hydrolase n=1 Tax=Aestuariibacter sp. GS-14 TaxID=2590670 RepID=UPI00112726A1|nr:alpha/beta hydrolase [Aestuariibacter sp. GS-14]TPV58506.1 alpha/beta hydrolase [Aestuariibacter sp. GS-14]
MTFIHPAVAPELVEPLKALLDVTASNPPLSGKTLGFYRKRNKFNVAPAHAYPVIQSYDIEQSADAPGVRVWVINASADTKKPAMLHFHGGGFVMGSCQNGFSRMQQVALSLDCVVVSVDYGLAPEMRIGEVVKQSYAALAWTHQHSETLGIDNARIGLLGFSAGGGHAALLAQYAVYRNEYAVKCQALIYPMLDDRTGTTLLPEPPKGMYLWTAEQNQYGWQAALGHTPGKSSIKPFTVPARQSLSANLPATYIAVGDLDLFYDENLHYAHALQAQGVAVTLNKVPGAFHAFESIAPESELAKAFNREFIDALRRML